MVLGARSGPASLVLVAVAGDRVAPPIRLERSAVSTEAVLHHLDAALEHLAAPRSAVDVVAWAGRRRPSMAEVVRAARCGRGGMAARRSDLRRWLGEVEPARSAVAAAVPGATSTPVDRHLADLSAARLGHDEPGAATSLLGPGRGADEQVTAAIGQRSGSGVVPVLEQRCPDGLADLLGLVARRCGLVADDDLLGALDDLAGDRAPAFAGPLAEQVVVLHGDGSAAPAGRDLGRRLDGAVGADADRAALAASAIALVADAAAALAAHARHRTRGERLTVGATVAGSSAVVERLRAELGDGTVVVPELVGAAGLALGAARSVEG